MADEDEEAAVAAGGGPSTSNMLHGSIQDQHDENEGHHGSRREKNPVDVVVRNCSIHLCRTPILGGRLVVRTLVKDVSLSVRSGELFAIMGGSGSGKTTLLNVIAGRYQASQLQVDGSLLFRSSQGEVVDYNRHDVVGYVTQSDYLLPFLTVRETLSYAAELRMPRSVPSEVRRGRVEEVVLDLGLKECAHTLVGNEHVRGISGGEKRRVSVGIQILTDPPVLTLDEPTSGLDAFTSHNLIETLARLAHGRGKTVIASIHQPRSDVFYRFDSAMLLSYGRPTYCGKVSAMADYFSSLGFTCPQHMSIADYCVDVSSIDPRTKEVEEADRRRVDGLVSSYYQHFKATLEAELQATGSGQQEARQQASQQRLPGGGKGSVRPKVSWTRQVLTLTSRFTTNWARDAGNIQGGLLQALLLGLVIMAIFWQLPSTLSGIRSRYGIMYIASSAEPYILLIILVERFCTEMKVFDRERQDGMYSPSAYMVAHFLSSLPQNLLQPLLHALPIYFGGGLRPGAAYVINFCAVSVMLTLLTSGLAWWCVSLHRAFSVASLIANTQYTFIGLTSGFLVVFASLPPYVKWVKHISFQSYAYRLLVTGEFSGRYFDACPYGDARQPACLQYQGDFVLSSLGIAKDDYKEPWLVLWALFLCYHLLALLCLHAIEFPPSAMAGVVTDGGADGKAMEDVRESVAAPTSNERAESPKHPPSITITVHDLSLSVSLPPSSSAAAPPAVAAVGSSPEARLQQHPLRKVTSWECLQMSGMLQSPARPSRKTPATPAPESAPSSSSQTSPYSGAARKQLLYGIHATFRPGRVAALMGGSGSGKTTLLNLLAGRTPVTSSSSLWRCLAGGGGARSNYEAVGDVRYNGSLPSVSQVRQSVGYVQQQDFLLPSLTVRETLRFSALMRLPRDRPYEDKIHTVEAVLQLLGLRGCADTLVGGEEVKGISGGEKRRVSLALQMLLDPPVLLLDEPTSGLDTFTARHVMETLKALAGRGRTIILSIHQPRSDVFALLDDVVLLSRGRLVWSGSSDDMLVHLESQGLVLPPLTNPAEFILDVSSIDLRNEAVEAESRARVTALVQAFKSVVSAQGVEAARGPVPGPVTKVAVLESVEEAPLWWCLPLVLRRSFINLRRQPTVISSRISQGLFFGLILAMFYAPLGHDQAAVQNRMGLLYESTALCFIGMLNCIAVFPAERNVFYREYLDGGQSATAFYLTYLLLTLPFVAVSGLALSVLITYVMGLVPTTEALGVFTYVLFCIVLTGECIGVAFCLVFYHLGFSVNVMSVVLSIFCMIAGFIGLDVPVFIDKINHISPLKWGAWIMTNVAFDDIDFTCTTTVNGRCPIADGQQVIELYKMTRSRGGGGVAYWAIALVTCGYALLAYAVLRLRMHNFTGIHS